jgi:S1-C subfamily serine protease
MFKRVPFGRGLMLAAAFMAIAAVAGFSQAQQGIQAPPSAAYRGVLILAVQPGSPADTAGLARGDIILSVNGVNVNSTDGLARAIDSQQPGAAVSIRYLHGDVDRTISITLGNQNGLPLLGVTLAPEIRGPLVQGQPGTRGFGGPYGRQGPDDRYGFGYGYGQVPPMMRGFAARGLGGAYVASVTANSPAAKAGIVVGDIIEAVDGTGVDASHDLASLIAAKKPGDQVSLIVRSPADRFATVSVALGENPSAAGKSWLGISYSQFPGFAGLAPRAPVAPGVTGGVWIVQVAPDSPAARAGIAQGDVITAIDGVTVSTPRDVTATIASHKPGDTLALTVWNTATSKSTDVTVTLGQNPSVATEGWLGVSLRAYNVLGGPRYSGAPGFPMPFWQGPNASPGAPRQPAPQTPAPAPGA